MAYVTKEQQEKQLKVFGIGLPVICFFLAWRHGVKHEWDILSYALLGVGVVVLYLTICYQPGLKWLFQRWMKVAYIIGFVITTLLLSVIYLFLFTPISLVLKLVGKDYMHQRGGELKSYWMECLPEMMNKDNMKNQF